MVKAKKVNNWSTGIVWKKSAEERLFYSKDLPLMLDAVKGTRNPQRNRLIIITFVKSFRRVSELRLLKVSDINFDERLIKWTIKKKKGGDYKVLLGADDELLNALGEYILACGTNPDEYVFFSPMSRLIPLHRKTLWWIIKQAGKKAGLEFLHPHVFRHNSITEARKQGVHPFIIKKLAQHSTYDITVSYDEILSDDERGAMEKINIPGGADN